jgi:hypothetical protein
MCACEPGFTCSRCAGTWLADDYPERPDERRSPWETDENREATVAD